MKIIGISVAAISIYGLASLFRQGGIVNITRPTENIKSDIKGNSGVTTPTTFPTPTNRQFLDSFDIDTRLEEGGYMNESKSLDWWLNSGAWMLVKNGVASTLIGDEPQGSKWQLAFAKNNPDETDSGTHPQNIFRLVTRTKWQNLSQQVYFRVIADHLSSSVHRRESNGLLLFNRYLDGDNLYYTGIRVDGYVTVKKKIGGVYYTLAQAKILDGNYDRTSRPTLLPHNKWIGLKTDVTNEGDTVHINLYLDLNKSGIWQLVLQADDKKGLYGGSPFYQAGYGGIRTDFMDVEFDNYKIEEKI